MLAKSLVRLVEGSTIPLSISVGILFGILCLIGLCYFISKSVKLWFKNLQLGKKIESKIEEEVISIIIGKGKPGLESLFDRLSEGIEEFEEEFHISNPEEWGERMKKEIEQNGFINVFQSHFKEFVEAFHSSKIETKPVHRELYEMMVKDPELGEHLKSLNVNDLKEVKTKPEIGTFHGHGFHRTMVVEEAKILNENILEGDGSPMVCYQGEKNVEFENWGKTVNNSPNLTCVPTTVKGVCNIVKWAKERNKKVRCSGYRHTWSNMYSSNGNVLISMIPLETATKIPTVELASDPKNELQKIELIGTTIENGIEYGLCRIGAGVTNEMFRKWSFQGGEYTLPLNVIMVEITFGGSNAPICHGAGIRHGTLSDLVREMEFVNAQGEIQIVKDQEMLKAASGCFGIMGVVVSMVLRLDKMTYAEMRPCKIATEFAIPPPIGYEIPKEILGGRKHPTKEELEKANEEFISRCENDYYSEWFWFVFQDRCWVNTWKNTGKKEKAVDYPGKMEVFIQHSEEYIGNFMTDRVIKALPHRAQAKLVSSCTMSLLGDIKPNQPPITTHLINGLHFRRGIQNMRVMDMEFEIPIPGRIDDPTKPDWSICNRAWWDCINAIYARKDVPVRLAVEMRIMGSSSVLMAPQYGNQFGTCSIEFLSPMDTPVDSFKDFMQEMCDKWMSYRDGRGKLLNVRPHWAKQWEELKVKGQPMINHLRDVAYQENIPEFKKQMRRIARDGGYSPDEMESMFSSYLMNGIFGSLNEE